MKWTLIFFKISTRTTTSSATATTTKSRAFSRRRIEDRPEPNSTTRNLRVCSSSIRKFCPISSRWLGPKTGTFTTLELGKNIEPRILRRKKFRERNRKFSKPFWRSVSFGATTQAWNTLLSGNHRLLSNTDCLSFVMCPLLAPLVIGFFICCGRLQY